MPARIEDYALIGDCETAALVSRDGSIDWLCWPRFDSDACFAALLGTPDHGRWLLAPADASAKVTRRYRDYTMILETTFETSDGAVMVIDFMPLRDGESNVVRTVVGLRGSVAMKTQIILRFGYGSIVPWVSRLDDGSLRAIAGPDMIIIKSEVPLRGEGLTTVADFTVAEGERVSFVMTWGPSHSRRPSRSIPITRSTSPSASGRVGRRVHVHRGVARCRHPLGAHAQGAHLSTDRRHRRRADDVAARADRRRSQLGLSLLLAARRDAHAARAHGRRLLPRGGGVARLAAPRRGRKPRSRADHVRAERRAHAPRVGGPVAAGI